jgi:hypothetical protein
MRVRSWMAALALIAGTSIAVGRAMPAPSPIAEPVQGPASQADPAAGSSQTQSAKPKPSEEPIKSIFLNLEIAGLGREGCDVEVMAANPSCKFGVINLKREGGRLVRAKDGAQHVSSVGHAIVELQNVELRGADRTCTVKIAVHESGQPEKTVYRGFRIPDRTRAGATAAPGQSLSFTCLLSASSKVATAEQSRSRK